MNSTSKCLAQTKDQAKPQLLCISEAQALNRTTEDITQHHEEITDSSQLTRNHLNAAQTITSSERLIKQKILNTDLTRKQVLVSNICDIENEVRENPKTDVWIEKDLTASTSICSRKGQLSKKESCEEDRPNTTAGENDTTSDKLQICMRK